MYPYTNGWEGSKTDSVAATMYVFNAEFLKNDPELFAENLPSERYLDIIKEGAEQFRLDPVFVERKLRNTKCVPRKEVNELRCFNIPFADDSAPIWTLDEVTAKDTENDEIVYLGLNEKVLRFDLRLLPQEYGKMVRLNRGK